MNLQQLINNEKQIGLEINKKLIILFEFVNFRLAQC